MQATTQRTNNFGIDISCIELNLLIESITIDPKLTIVIIVIIVIIITILTNDNNCIELVIVTNFIGLVTC